MTDKYQTQWAGQFYSAAELVRRGYLVSFTLGNAPGTDLHVTSPKGVSFRVECKSMRTRTTWLFKVKPDDEDRYFVFCFIPSAESIYPSFYVLTNQQALDTIESKKLRVRSQRGATSDWSDASFGDIKKFEGLWNSLPG
jgi:hypothetical protein